MKNILSFALLIFLAPTTISAQQDYLPEVIDDPYIAVPKEKRKYSPAHKSILRTGTSSIFTTQVNISQDGMNILDDAANEPTIGIDPTNPLRMVIGWRQFETIESNFRQAGIAYTEDGGTTWTNLPPLEAEKFRSDPVIDTDSQGKFYYNSLSQQFTCDVFQSTDLNDWSDKTFAHGGDKQWMVIDKTNQISNGQAYAYWRGTQTCSGNFARAIEFAEGFEPCTNLASSILRGTITIDPSGDVYGFGSVSSKFRVIKSSTAKIPGAEINWEQNTEVNMGGRTSLYQGPNPGGLLGQAWVTTDHSFTNLHGNVYLLATVEREFTPDNADIMFARSTNEGQDWSSPIKINDDAGLNYNWFGTISVAPNGRIDVAWVDNRNSPDTYLSALYYSFSMDGGLTWSANECLSEEFDPHIGYPNQEKIGDYYHMISTNEGAHLAWAGTFTGGQDVYYSYIIPNQEFSTTNELDYISNFSVFPNPTTDNFTIQFDNIEQGQVKISLLNLNGQELKILRNEVLQAGRQNINIKHEDIGEVHSGLYIIKLESSLGASNIVKLAIH